MQNKNTTSGIQIVRIDAETNEREPVTLEYAISKLEGYWDVNKIRELLVSGQELWTPYATYSIAQ